MRGAPGLLPAYPAGVDSLKKVSTCIVVVNCLGQSTGPYVGLLVKACPLVSDACISAQRKTQNGKHFHLKPHGSWWGKKYRGGGGVLVAGCSP